MSYIGTEPKDIRSFGRTKFDYTATQGQTAFTGADDDGKVLAFTVGQIEVYVNGILMDDSDFTTTGTGTVTLASAANLNDVINIVSFESNIPDNDYVPASGGTFSGNVTNSGTVTNSGNVTVGGTLGVTGDFTVDTDTLKVNTSDDRVLINTTLAGRATEGADILTVAAPDNGHSGITVRSGTSSYGSFYFSDATTGAGEYAASMQFNHSNNQLALGVGGSDFLKIDSSGRVTTPNQPGFWVQADNNTGDYQAGPVVFSSSPGYSLSSNVQTGSLISNGGTHFNTANGRFTAPVAGLYQFNAQVRLDNFGGSFSYITLWDSGSTNIGRSLNSINTTYYTHIVSTTRYLSANDYVYVTLVSGGDSSVGLSSDSWFSGFLVG